MTGRSLPTGLGAALEAEHVESFVLVHMDLAGGSLYLCGAPFDVDHGGNTYLSLHGLGTIERITETDSEQAGLSFSISAVADSVVALALTEDVQGRPVTVSLAVVDGATLRVDPVAWQGFLDVLSIEEGAAPKVRVTAEHQLVAWEEPAGLMYSDADQQLLHPGDKFFEYTASITNVTIAWPTAEALRAEA